MPEPVKHDRRYMPGLDGLRAIAVIGVMLLPPQIRLGRRWAARRRCVLHPQRLPDHGHPAQPGEQGRDQAEVVLAGPRPPPAAGALPDADRGDGVGDGDRPAPARRLPHRRAQRRRLLQQLVADLPPRLLLRTLRPALAAEPPLVALGRGAVLHPLAVPADARAALRPRGEEHHRGAPPPRRRHPDRGALLGHPDGGPLPPLARSLARLLRDRHAGARAADRRGAGDGLAEPPPARAHRPAGAVDDRRRPASPAWS